MENEKLKKAKEILKSFSHIKKIPTLYIIELYRIIDNEIEKAFIQGQETALRKMEKLMSALW